MMVMLLVGQVLVQLVIKVVKNQLHSLQDLLLSQLVRKHMNVE